jgi:hypothetical protein
MYATTFGGTTDHVIVSSSAMCKTTPCTIPFPLHADRENGYMPTPTLTLRVKQHAFPSACNDGLSQHERKTRRPAVDRMYVRPLGGNVMYI